MRTPDYLSSESLRALARCHRAEADQHPKGSIYKEVHTDTAKALDDYAAILDGIVTSVASSLEETAGSAANDGVVLLAARIATILGENHA